MYIYDLQDQGVYLTPKAGLFALQIFKLFPIETFCFRK